LTEQRTILIAGPTASGKSGLALALAEQLGGVVINADSMQVYRELRVLTARPAAEDEARAPHWLYGHVPASEAYSAGRFVTDASDAIGRARREGLRPIIVGGTGLYFKALLEGLSPVPPIPDDVRTKWREMEKAHGTYAMWQVLTERDPVMAFRLDPSDGQRIVRSLEVHDATGTSLAEWQRTPGVPVLVEKETVRFVVLPERDELHRRCDARFEAMMAAGALEEVRALALLSLSPELPAMRALGVRPLMQHIAGDVTLDEAIKRAKAETRQYVKRQATWIKGNMTAWNTISTQEMESISRDKLAFINW
jgi:tRNA dimethylallyltransferase